MSTDTQPAPEAGAEETELRRRRFAALSDDVALKIFTATATVAVLGRLGFDPTVALLGAAFSPVLAELIKAAVERRGLRRRHLLLGTLLLFLVHGVERAIAAVRRRPAPTRERPPPLEVHIASRTLLLAGALASALAVAAFTAAEAVSGSSLVADRRLTFFSVDEPLPPDVVAPALKVPSSIVVESRGPRPVWFTVSATDQRDGSVEPVCSPRPGARFPIGKTRVQCNATDEAGNRKAGRFSVTVVQVADGIWMRFPSRVDVEAAGPGGAVAGFAVRATDSNGEAVAAACAPPAGSLFPIGTTTVTCTARAGSEAATRRFPVVVADTTPPRLRLPGGLQVETARLDRGVDYKVSASDRVDGEVAVDCSPRSGSQFSVGATPVQCSAVDAHGNDAHAGFTVTVARSDDTTPPELDLPDDPVVGEATSRRGAVVLYDVDADDNRDDQPSVTCSPRSGSLFPLGHSRVECVAVDAVGNQASGSFAVIASDTRPPALTVPGNQVVEAVSRNGAPVSYVVSARDAVDETIEPSCSPRSGLVLPLGTTDVRCTARDTAGNSAAANFEVTVRDTIGPVIEAGGKTTAEATSRSGARIRYRVSARDAVDGSVGVECSPRAGSTFGLGDTTVACRAADKRGNSSEMSFTVSVADTTGPTVYPPTEVSAEARSRAGAVVEYGAAKAVDRVYGAVRATCSPAAGSTFRLGETIVTCTATDGRGNTGRATFRVTVRDTTPPILRLKNKIVYIDRGMSGADVTYRRARDAVDGFIEPTCSPPSGSFFRKGTTTAVECSARDRSGNVSPTVRFTVTVIVTPE